MNETVTRADAARRMIIRALAVLACALAALLTVLALLSAIPGGVHIDHAHGTYGLSVGTDSRYCSLELNTGAHGGGIDAWCQTAG